MRRFQGKYFYWLEVVLFFVFIFTGCNQTQKIPTGGDIWGYPDASISTPGQGTGPGQTPSITPIPVPSITPISFPAPVITAVTPNSGSVGTQITIAGNNFGDTQGSSVVTFNGTAALPTDTVLWTNTQIVIKIPAGATTGNIQITVNNKVSNGFYLDVLFSGGPTIISLSATSGKIGSEVTIQGMNFGDDENKGVITFNGVAVHNQTTVTHNPITGELETIIIVNILRWTNTHITIKVPTYALSGEVKVTVNSITSNGVFFQVLNEDGSPAGPPATITSLSPNSGYYGTQVTINGSGFGNSQGTSTVTFNSIYATDVISWSNTQIVVNVPNNATSGNVVVKVNGAESNGVNFDVLSPTITSISPISGSVGTTVTITGLNFGTTQGTGTVIFLGKQSGIDTSINIVNYPQLKHVTNVLEWSDMVIKIAVPDSAESGYVVLMVNTNNSLYESNRVWFEVPSLTNPTINNLSPSTGPVGTTVTITGINFGSTQGTSSVIFNYSDMTENGLTATVITSWTDSKIVANVPVGAVDGNVVVKVGSKKSNKIWFEVL